MSGLAPAKTHLITLEAAAPAFLRSPQTAVSSRADFSLTVLPTGHHLICKDLLHKWQRGLTTKSPQTSLGDATRADSSQAGVLFPQPCEQLCCFCIPKHSSLTLGCNDHLSSRLPQFCLKDKQLHTLP